MRAAQEISTDLLTTSAYSDNAEGIDSYLSFWDPLTACTITNPALVTTQVFKLLVWQELDEEDDQSAKIGGGRRQQCCH